MPSLRSRVLGDGFAPVVQQINERLLPAYYGAPTRFLTKARGVPHHDGQIDRAKEGRVSVDLDRDGGVVEESLEQLTDAPGLTGADIVDRSRLSLDCNQPVGVHYVAHVGKVTAHLQASGPQDRFL